MTLAAALGAVGETFGLADAALVVAGVDRSEVGASEGVAEVEASAAVGPADAVGVAVGTATEEHATSTSAIAAAAAILRFT
ncbi:MAG TPA: hypothetical protein VH371_03265 [Candidatus Limnocylindrales bacterium]